MAASAFIAMAAALSSCDSAPSTNVTLATEMDSVSYSFGASVGENLQGALQQMRIVSDTVMVSTEYRMKIEGEQDASKKEALKKEMRSKIDSTHKANEYAIAQFLIGFEKAVSARESEESHNFGFSVGSQVAMQGGMMKKQLYGEDSKEVLNSKAITAAVAAAMLHKEPAMAHASSYLMGKSQEIQQREREKTLGSAADNQKAGDEFLAANKAKAGVVELPSGLQYKVLTEGTGAKPTETSSVKCHYHGTLINGTVFDSSVNRGTPAEFEVNRVIAGWTEALQLMPAGSKWELYIPSDLAYGEFGSGDKIGPNTVLVFEVELLEVL